MWALALDPAFSAMLCCNHWVVLLRVRAGTLASDCSGVVSVTVSVLPAKHLAGKLRDPCLSSTFVSTGAKEG